MNDIKAVFNSHDSLITCKIEGNKIICENENGSKVEFNAYGGSGFSTRLGLGSLNGFSNNIRAYDIEVLS